MKNKNHRFNLTSLEDDALLSYKAWEKDQANSELRTNVFLTVKELAYAVLSVGDYTKYNIDYDKCSYEYSLYLFERIIIGTFKMVPHIPGTRFPLQAYMRKNIMHIVLTMKNEVAYHELLTDLEFLLEDFSRPSDDLTIESSIENINFEVDRFKYSGKLLKSLRIFYSLEEIKRLLSLSLELLYNDPFQFLNNDTPKDIRDFCITLVSLAKRLIKDQNINFDTNVPKEDIKKALTSAVRSTVFLSTVVNTEFFPRELLLTLDIDSLYRLVYILGGQTIKIPTKRELDTLLGAVVTISKSIMEGKDPRVVLNETKKEYDLFFSNTIHMQTLISKALETYNIFSEDKESMPLLNILAMSMGSINILFKQLEKKSENMSTDSIIKEYVELSSSFSKLTESLSNIKIHLSENKGK